MADFGGTISDLGGPTANLYATSCGSPTPCTRHDCFNPRVCNHLRVDESALLDLLERASSIPGVKHVFVSSGLRMELLLKTPRLLRRILFHHTPGAMKIAPEHTEPEVLRLMHKRGAECLPQFLNNCRELARAEGKSIRFTPYFISSHPGCTLDHMKELAGKLQKLSLTVRQFQDFTPTPGTLSTAMFVTGLDRDTLKPIHVARGGAERRAQRMMLEETALRARGRPVAGSKDREDSFLKGSGRKEGTGPENRVKKGPNSNPVGKFRKGRKPV